MLPMRQGTVWVYRGPTKWTLPGTDTVKERTLTWKSEIVDRAETAGIEAALRKGHPTDLAWYAEGKQPGDHLFLRQGNRYYHLEGEKARTCFSAIRTGTAPLERCLSPNALFVDLPLTLGKVFGGNEPLARNIGMYAWIVERIDRFSLKGIRGAPARTATRYLLTYRTNPDHQFAELVEGIGMTRYTYGHHGTVSETDLRLVELRSPPMRAQ
jgi:hypothetical protein